MPEYSKGKNKAILLFFFICIAIFFWIEPSIFFLRDDLYYIAKYFFENRLDFILSPHWGHVMPVFRFVYFSEIFLFGKNAILFQLLGLILLGMMAFLYSRMYRRVTTRNTVLALVIAVMMIAHPDWTEVTLWVFEICIILQLFFQALTILIYYKYVENDNQKYFFLFLGALILQNYCFGNGVFFPLLFIFALLLEKGSRKSHIISLVVIQIAFLLIQKFHSEQAIYISDLLHNYKAVLLNYYNFISISAVRFFIVKQVFGSAIQLASLVLFLVLSMVAYRNDKKATLFFLAYFFVASISVPLARPNLRTNFHYYYTTLLFPALFSILYISFSKIDAKLFKVAFVFFGLCLCGYFFIDLKAKRIYGYMDFKNKERLMDAINYNKEYYYPYDELYVTDGIDVYLDNMSDASIQKSIQKNSYFELGTGLQNYFVKQNGDSAQLVINEFKYRSKSTMQAYKLLQKHSFIDFDITYEKK